MSRPICPVPDNTSPYKGTRYHVCKVFGPKSPEDPPYDPEKSLTDDNCKFTISYVVCKVSESHKLKEMYPESQIFPVNSFRIPRGELKVFSLEPAG